MLPKPPVRGHKMRCVCVGGWFVTIPFMEYRWEPNRISVSVADNIVLLIAKIWRSSVYVDGIFGWRSCCCFGSLFRNAEAFQSFWWIIKIKLSRLPNNKRVPLTVWSRVVGKQFLFNFFHFNARFEFFYLPRISIWMSVRLFFHFPTWSSDMKTNGCALDYQTDRFVISIILFIHQKSICVWSQRNRGNKHDADW